MSQERLRSDEFGNLLMIYKNGRMDVKPRVGSPVVLGQMDDASNSLIVERRTVDLTVDGWVVSLFAANAVEAGFIVVSDLDSGIRYKCQRDVFLGKCVRQEGDGYLSVASLALSHWSIDDKLHVQYVEPSWFSYVGCWFYVLRNAQSADSFSFMNKSVPVLNNAFCESALGLVRQLLGDDRYSAWLLGADEPEILLQVRESFRTELLSRKLFLGGLDVSEIERLQAL